MISPAFYGRHSLFIAGYTICQSGDDRRTWRDLIAGRGAVSGELFGQSNCVILRESCKPFDFAFSLITRSLAHICGGIAQSHDNLESEFESR